MYLLGFFTVVASGRTDTGGRESSYPVSGGSGPTSSTSEVRGGMGMGSGEVETEIGLGMGQGRRRRRSGISDVKGGDVGGVSDLKALG